MEILNLSKYNLQELTPLEKESTIGGGILDSIGHAIGYAVGYVAGIVADVYQGTYEHGYDAAQDQCNCK